MGKGKEGVGLEKNGEALFLVVFKECGKMKITMIHGQNHKGSTYHIGRMLAEKIGGEITEFFLPRDFSGYCTGCVACIVKDESLCAHHEQLQPILQAMDEADVLILTSPVYVYHVTGQMKAFLDHCAYRWMMHRPEERMFSKQAVCISTAAGAGMKSPNRDMADSLFFWGVPAVYRLGYAVHAASYSKVSEELKAKIDKDTTALAEKIRAKNGRVKPGIKTRGFFYLVRKIHGRSWNEADCIYWEKKGWDKRARPWKKNE